MRAIAAAVAVALLATPTALAGHQFTDVPDNHQFHTEISIFKDTNITTGCTATEYCPSDYVRRQAMAAFIDRALGLLVRPGESTQKAVPGSRVAMIDDDVSFVGTQDGALELSYNGVQALRLEQGAYGTPNVIGGIASNSVTAGAYGATIAGGAVNRVTDNYGSVGGGVDNQAGDAASPEWDRCCGTVAGGSENTASGQSATVPGGVYNTAAGRYSFAAGRRAKANHDGAFMWADSTDADFSSFANNLFAVRATGGVSFYTSWPTSGIPEGCHLAAGSGSWDCTSDRNAKEAFAPVDRQALLRRLARLPITSWRYRRERGMVRHLGPMAQDFRAAFGLGRDRRHISAVDADGVALAAIQALYAENRALKRELALVKRTVARLVEDGP
jgi:hypothetical protein